MFSAEFHEHIWTTCALLVLECNSDENIGFQIDLVRDIQELASNPAQNIRLSYASRYQESSISCTLTPSAQRLKNGARYIDGASQCCGSVNFSFGSLSVSIRGFLILNYRCGSVILNFRFGYVRPINYGSGRIRLLSGHFLAI